MSWKSGSGLMSDIINAMDAVDDKVVRRKVYELLILAFEEMDCDTLYECRSEDKAFDEAFVAVSSHYYADEDDEGIVEDEY